MEEEKEITKREFNVFLAKAIVGCSGLALISLLIWSTIKIEFLLAIVLTSLLLIFLFGLNLYQSEKKPQVKISKNPEAT